MNRHHPKLLCKSNIKLVIYTTEEQASRDPLRGNLYENFIISEILKGALNRGIRPEVYFFRDSHGNEVDLLVREKSELIPVEIKSAGTFSPDFLRGLDRFKALEIKRGPPARSSITGSSGSRYETSAFSTRSRSKISGIPRPRLPNRERPDFRNQVSILNRTCPGASELTPSAYGALRCRAAGHEILYFLFVLCHHLGGRGNEQLPVALRGHLETGRNLGDALHYGGG